MAKTRVKNDIDRAVIVNLREGIDVSPKVIEQVFNRRANMSEEAKSEFDDAALGFLRQGGKLPCRIISNLIRRSSKFTAAQQALLAEQTLQPEIEPGERSEILSVLNPGWQSTG